MSVPIADLVVAVASPEDADELVEVIHAAFGARPPLDPPATAVDETPESVARSLAKGGGVLARVAGRPAGAILVVPDDSGTRVSFRRVSVHPDWQRHGIASAMVSAAEELAATLGFQQVELFARRELSEVLEFWQHRGFRIDRPAPYGVVLSKRLPLAIRVPTSARMRDLGARLARVLEPGDVVIASGDLGAGKTTLTQGIGVGLGAAGPVISPTFVLSRIHPAHDGGPALVHVDAYRLSSPEELDDLDLDATVPTAVTVVEWGLGLAEGLAEHRLELDIMISDQPADESGDSERVVTVRPVGERWSAVDLAGALGVRDER